MSLSEATRIWRSCNLCGVELGFKPRTMSDPSIKGRLAEDSGAYGCYGYPPQDTATYLPIGDSELTAGMNALVNERPARNHKGVTCRIEPLRPYGDIMDIGGVGAEFGKIERQNEYKFASTPIRSIVCMLRLSSL